MKILIVAPASIQSKIFFESYNTGNEKNLYLFITN